jgi:hypothetical protein
MKDHICSRIGDRLFWLAVAAMLAYNAIQHNRKVSK